MRNKLLFVLVLVTGLIVAGCSKDDNPKNTFQSYLDAMQKKDYKAMYSYLASDAKKTITEDAFIKRYTSINDGIDVKKITATPKYPDKFSPDKDGLVSISYDNLTDTLHGDIKFQNTIKLKKEKVNNKNEWKILWNTKAIFPDLSDGDKVRISKINAKRGSILDRNNVLLATDGGASDVGLVPKYFDNNKATSISEVSKILNVSVAQIETLLSASYVKSDTFVPIKTISNDDKDNIAKLKNIKGVLINNKSVRTYPLKEKAAHFTGYIQKITVKELQTSNEGYQKDDLIGKAGIEFAFEKELRAKNGVEIYIIDSSENKKKVLLSKPAEDGKDIVTTIDSKMQAYAFDLIKNSAGTTVAMHPKTGEILSLVSLPSFDPNKFIIGFSNDEWKLVSENAKKPFYCRFQNAYVPGSTFKTITAAIGLEAKTLDPQAIKTIKGKSWQKDKNWGNYNITRATEYSSPSNLLNAFIYSDNIYFAQTALSVGKDEFANQLKKFGIGEKMPFEFDLAASQISSDGTIKSEVQLADTGYGQAKIQMNPVHFVSIYSMLVNDGSMIQPTLIKNQDLSPKFYKKDIISSQNTNIILKDLEQVVQNVNGTAHSAYISNKKLAGKTGTAEIKASVDDKTGTEYGWFIALNIDNPQLLILTMLEDVKDKGGSHVTLPIVKQLFQQFLK